MILQISHFATERRFHTNVENWRLHLILNAAVTDGSNIENAPSATGQLNPGLPIEMKIRQNTCNITCYLVTGGALHVQATR